VVLGYAAWFLAGLGALVVGAEAMVRGAARVASRLGISPIVVGLTVVSIGTSMAELAVGVVAAVEGSGALAVGNIAGTNVVNLLFALGLSALILPLAIEMRTLRFELPVMAGAAILLWVLAANGELSRVDGLILVIGAIAYTYAVIRAARRETREASAAYAEAYPADGTRTSSRQTAVNVGMTLGGIAIVVLGAEWLVDGAVGLAREFAVSDALIGLTVVAIGTSAPELVTTVVSTLRGERDIAVGNPARQQHLQHPADPRRHLLGARARTRVDARAGPYRHPDNGGRHAGMHPHLHHGSPGRAHRGRCHGRRLRGLSGIPPRHTDVSQALWSGVAFVYCA
jgi:cation:H+ antiporter